MRSRYFQRHIFSGGLGGFPLPRVPAILYDHRSGTIAPMGPSCGSISGGMTILAMCRFGLQQSQVQCEVSWGEETSRLTIYHHNGKPKLYISSTLRPTAPGVPVRRWRVAGIDFPLQTASRSISSPALFPFLPDHLDLVEASDAETLSQI